MSTRLLDRLITPVSPRAALRRAIRLTEQKRLGAAFRLLSVAARAGLPEAEYRVGRCYLEGGGVPPSRTDGMRWLEKAAGHGFVEAQSLLATLLIQAAPDHAGAGPTASLFSSGERDGKPDFDRALHWAKRAAENGSADGAAGTGLHSHLRPGDDAQPGGGAHLVPHVSERRGPARCAWLCAVAVA